MQQSRKLIRKFTTSNEKSLKASYLVSLQIACTHEIEGRTTSAQIFKVLNDSIDQNGILWKKCVGVCLDGARAMTGRHVGVVTRIQSVAPNAVFTHCNIHREALAAKTLQSSFKDVMDNAIKVVNLIKARALNSRMFTIMCNDIGAEHDKLLLHTEVQWLSRGKVLFQLFELRAEVRLFLIDINSSFQNLFCDDVWLSKLAYLADVFRFLNELNLSLQGATADIFQLSDKINSTVRKLPLKLGDIEKNNLAAFPLLCEFISENDLHVNSQLKSDIAQHCQQLIEKSHLYFPKNYEDFD